MVAVSSTGLHTPQDGSKGSVSSRAAVGGDDLNLPFLDLMLVLVRLTQLAAMTTDTPQHPRS